MSSPREHFGTRLGFLMASIGSAVGLGILWKFPYVVGANGGGVFLLAYLLCVLLLGIPLLLGELLLGKASQRGCVGAYTRLGRSTSSAWKAVGYLGMGSSFLIMSFYSVIAGWGLSYLLLSLMGGLNAAHADQVVNLYSVLSSSGSVSLLWHALFTALTVSMVFSGIRKGIERWSKLMTKALLLLLIGLFLYATQLDGFGRAVDFIFGMRFDAFHVGSLIDALGLALFTLSLGQGVMISYGSYIRADQPLIKMSLIIGASVLVVALLFALTIFPIVFTFDFRPDVGIGLTFQTLPYLFAQLKGSLLISTLFFILFTFTALTSAIPLVEVVTSNLMELHGLTRKRAVLLVGGASFLLGIPSAFAKAGHPFFPMWDRIYGFNFLETVDHLVVTWMIPIGGLLSALFLGFVVDRNKLLEQLEDAPYTRLTWQIWRVLVRYLVPLAILMLLLENNELLSVSDLMNLCVSICSSARSV